MDAYILSAEMVHMDTRRPDNDEIKRFINFIEGIIPGKLNLLYSIHMFNLHKIFQYALADLKAGFSLIFQLEEALLLKEKPFEMRYVITYGEIEVPKRKHMFFGIVGSGIARAEVKMGILGSRSGERFYMDLRDREESSFLTKLFGLYQGLYDSWKPKDCKLAAQLISLWDYNFIAKELGKSRSLIWRRRKSLKIKEYNNIKDLILKTPDLIIKKKFSKSNEQPPAF
ncbi:MAG: hypothetical protein WCI48_04295 [Bacteroidota bacterium]|jgi:hypothetical protein